MVVKRWKEFFRCRGMHDHCSWNSVTNCMTVIRKTLWSVCTLTMLCSQLWQPTHWIWVPLLLLGKFLLQDLLISVTVSGYEFRGFQSLQNSYCGSPWRWRQYVLPTYQTTWSHSQEEHNVRVDGSTVCLHYAGKLLWDNITSHHIASDSTLHYLLPLRSFNCQYHLHCRLPDCMTVRMFCAVAITLEDKGCIREKWPLSFASPNCPRHSMTHIPLQLTSHSLQ